MSNAPITPIDHKTEVTIQAVRLELRLSYNLAIKELTDHPELGKVFDRTLLPNDRRPARCITRVTQARFTAHIASLRPPDGWLTAADLARLINRADTTVIRWLGQAGIEGRRYLGRAGGRPIHYPPGSLAALKRRLPTQPPAGTWLTRERLRLTLHKRGLPWNRLNQVCLLQGFLDLGESRLDSFNRPRQHYPPTILQVVLDVLSAEDEPVIRQYGYRSVQDLAQMANIAYIWVRQNIQNNIDRAWMRFSCSPQGEVTVYLPAFYVRIFQKRWQDQLWQLATGPRIPGLFQLLEPQAKHDAKVISPVWYINLEAIQAELGIPDNGWLPTTLNRHPRLRRGFCIRLNPAGHVEVFLPRARFTAIRRAWRRARITLYTKHTGQPIVFPPLMNWLTPQEVQARFSHVSAKRVSRAMNYYAIKRHREYRQDTAGTVFYALPPRSLVLIARLIARHDRAFLQKIPHQSLRAIARQINCDEDWLFQLTRDTAYRRHARLHLAPENEVIYVYPTHLAPKLSKLWLAYQGQ